IRRGKPYVGLVAHSAGELETRFNTKTEDLKRQIAEETLKERPKAAAEYKLPKLKGRDENELRAHALVAGCGHQAFEVALPQAKFEKAVETYIERMQPAEVPEETLKAELG